MIKGVNKQIIEIRCPKDERFEKILLFVNSEKCLSEDGDMNENAKLIAKRFLDRSCGKNRSRLGTALKNNRLVIGVSSAAFVVMLLYAVVNYV